MAGVTLGAHGTYIASAAATVGPDGVADRARLRLVGARAGDRDGGAPRGRRLLRGSRSRGRARPRRDASIHRPTSTPSADYRRHLAEVSAVRAVLQAAERAKG